MNSVALLRLVVLRSAAVLLQSCEFYFGKEYAKSLSQAELRSLFERRCDVPLTESEHVLNAYAEGGRDVAFWFRVSFDPQTGDALRERLLANGFLASRNRDYDYFMNHRIVPEAIASWWNPAAFVDATLLTFRSNSADPSSWADVVCLLDQSNGTLFAYSRSR